MTEKHKSSDCEAQAAFNAEQARKRRRVLDRLFERVKDPAFAQPLPRDLPIDRLMGVRVKDVADLIGHLDLMDVHMLMEDAIQGYQPTQSAPGPILHDPER
jgi:hypothetical protein